MFILCFNLAAMSRSILGVFGERAAAKDYNTAMLNLPLEELAAIGQTVHYSERERVFPAIVTATSEGRQTLFCLDENGASFTRRGVAQANTLTSGHWTPRPAIGDSHSVRGVSDTGTSPIAAEQTRSAGI